MREVEEVCGRAAACVDPGQLDEGRHGVAVGQRLQGVVAQVDGMRHRLLPVRVLVAHRREDLVQVEHVRVADKGPEDTVPLLLLAKQQAT